MIVDIWKIKWCIYDGFSLYVKAIFHLDQVCGVAPPCGTIVMGDGMIYVAGDTTLCVATPTQSVKIISIWLFVPADMKFEYATCWAYIVTIIGH